MPNLIERLLLNREAPPGRAEFGTGATTALLRRIVPRCIACDHSLDGHSYRFLSTHPADDGPGQGAGAFLAAVRSSDWATVHASQVPSVDHSIYVVYAIACPGDTGGMVAMLHAPAGPAAHTTLAFQTPLQAEQFAHLRALCPACKWVAF